VSASEKLKALEQRGAEGKWEIYEETHHEPTDDPKYTDRWILDNGVILNWGEGDIPLGPAELIVTLRNALPQIVAVVEAAERIVHGDETTWGTSDGVGFVLQDSLVALDEALS
jgi:hypothetical protein